MNIRKTANIFRENAVYYLTAFLILLGMKYFYSKAGSDELRWILSPTARWVEILSGIPFEYEQGAGYVNHDLRLLIAPSCSGVQFMIITMATLIFSFVHEMDNGHKVDNGHEMDNGHKVDNGHKMGNGRKNKFLWLIACMLLSYPLTVFVNGLRIITAIYLPLFLQGTALYGGVLTPERLHTLIGTVVYFVSLLTIYHLAGYFFRKKEDVSLPRTPAQVIRKCAPPVFWYFAIVLGIPLLNRAYQKNGEKFLEFAVLITACCAAVLLLYCLAHLTRKAFRRLSRRP